MFFQMPWLPELFVQTEDLRILDTSFTGSPHGAKPGTFKLLDIEAWKYTFTLPGGFVLPDNYDILGWAVLRSRSLKVLLNNQHISVVVVVAFTFTEATSPPLNYYRAVMRYRPSKIKSGNKMVQAPTLIIWGTGDTALGKPLAEMSLKYCQDGRVQYIEGASHWVQQEEPQKVNEFITKFLATGKSDWFPSNRNAVLSHQA